MGMLEYKNMGGDVGGGGKFKILRRSDWKCHCMVIHAHDQSGISIDP